MGFMTYLHNVSKNDEWYTPEEAVRLIVPYVPLNWVVWCPFDTQESEYVKVLTGAGHKVIHSHIKDGKDFFLYEPSEPYDCIISNPPYSKKEAVFQRLFLLGKPWAMFVPINGIFDSQKRFYMFRKYGIQLFVPKGRTKFIDSLNSGRNAPPFQAIYVCWNLLPQTIMFEHDDMGLFEKGKPLV